MIGWLLEGDIAIKFQTYRDLLGVEDKERQKKILKRGWGKQFLSYRYPDGHWGQRFYQPKWTSSHYTLIDLRNLCPDRNHSPIRNSITKIAREEKGIDGGINPSRGIANSDVCVNGMFLNYACYFNVDSKLLESLVDFILSQKMLDGGFNCRSNRTGARHSSLHTTLSITEGIAEYRRQGYSYRLKELETAEKESIEFMLLHQLFISDRTGKVIHKDFLRFAYPRRWRYDILSALDYFQHAGIKWDSRLQMAMDTLMRKRNKDGTWNLNAKHPGQTHFDMETAGKPSRWNTLRALRVLQHFGLQ
ncbi:MAG: hypothetical protein HKN76_08750 [Saprospiraceae bacterium]|nr:hypothetical protein [Saprospiraceae bacterium]